jgi:MFS family permease
MIGLSRERAGRIVPRSFVFITIFVDMLGYGIVIPLLPLYVARQAPGGTLVGVLGSLYALAQLAAGPVLGGLSDRYGRRPILLACLLGTSLAYLLLGLAGSLWLIVAAILLDGITGGNISAAQAYISDITSPEKRSSGFAIMGAAFGLGMIGGPAIGGLLSQWSLSAPAFVAAAIAGMNLLAGLLLLPESLAPERRSRKPLLALNPVSQISEALRSQPLRRLLLTILLVNLAFSGLQSNFPLFSRARFGWEAADTAYFYAYIGICAVATQAVLLGRLRPRFGERRLAIAGLALMAAALGLVAAAWQSWMLFPIVGLLALGSNLSIPCLTSLLSSRAGSSSQGLIMGSQQTAINLALIGGPLIAGLSFDHLGTAAPYALASLITCAAVVVCIQAD